MWWSWYLNRLVNQGGVFAGVCHGLWLWRSTKGEFINSVTMFHLSFVATCVSCVCLTPLFKCSCCWPVWLHAPILHMCTTPLRIHTHIHTHTRTQSVFFLSQMSFSSAEAHGNETRVYQDFYVSIVSDACNGSPNEFSVQLKSSFSLNPSQRHQHQGCDILLFFFQCTLPSHYCLHTLECFSNSVTHWNTKMV